MRRIVFAVMIPALAFAGWVRTYGTEEYFESGRCVRQTTDGGYVIVATWPNDATESIDLWLIKTDSLGDMMWEKIYGSGGEDKGKCIQQTQDGGYIITGYINGDPWEEAGDLWLIKTDSLGDTLWSRVYGGGFYSLGNWVEQTSDGGYIVTGSLDKTYLWLFKTDEDGYMEWEKTYEWGDYHETGYYIHSTNDGGYIVASNVGLFKTDSQGDSLWLKPWPGRCVQQTLDEGYIIIGRSSFNIRLRKTDANGDTLWTRVYGGGQEEDGYEVQQTTDDGYIIIGETRSFGEGNYDAWLIKTDSLGDTLWTRTFGDKHYDNARSVQQTSDGGYIIAGSFGEPEDYGFSNVWLIKTDSLGYVGVAEPPVQVESNWEVISPIGPQITLRYTNRPQGFHASIFDATGRKVDEVHSANCSGTITWGEGMSPGVYFVREESKNLTTIQKVILIR